MDVIKNQNCMVKVYNCSAGLFQELFELVQRKLLRQLSSYAEQHDVGVYPRVFAVDFMKTEKEGTDKVFVTGVFYTIQNTMAHSKLTSM